MLNSTLHNVVTLAAEAETTALFYNAKTVIELCRGLYALGHNQPLTLIKTDNSMAFRFITNFVNKKEAKVGICIFTGSKKNTMKSFQFTGNQVRIIIQIFSLNITHQNVIKKSTYTKRTQRIQYHVEQRKEGNFGN